MIALNTIQLNLLYLPFDIYLICFFNVTVKLNKWALQMKKELSGPLTPQSLRNCLNFKNALSISVEMFADHIFYSTIICLIFFITWLFRILSYFMSIEDFMIPVIFFVIGLIFFLLCTASLITGSNLTSQVVQDNVHELAKKIRYSDFEFQDSQGKILVNDQFMKIDVFKTYVIDELEEFKGFHGCGYFYLGKSHLTSLFANIVTYIIILIQFKVSELGEALWK